MAGTVILNVVNEIQYDAYGNAIASRDGYSFLSNQSGLMVSGTDGYNTHILRTNTSGVLKVDATSTTQPISGTVKITDAYSDGPVVVKQSNTAALASDAALVVALSPNLYNGSLPVSLYPSGAQDVQGNAVVVSRVTQITTKFYQQPPSSFLNITTTGGATATQGTGTNVGIALFSTGTATTAEVTGTTFTTVSYATQYEVFACMSARFTTPTSSASYQRVGIYNSSDGFAFGYNGLVFGIWTRYNGTDTFIAQTSWNKDTVSGVAGSYFTNANSPVVLVPTDFNMFRIRYGWYGSTPTYFEIMAPDGNWVLVHIARFSNTGTTVNITQPDLPMTVDVNKTSADGTNLIVGIGAFSAGVTAPSTGPIISGIGTISTVGGEVILPVLTQSAFSFSISGTWVGTIAFNYSLDGVTFTPDVVLDNSLGTFVETTQINNAYTANVGSFKFYQIIATAWTSGTATITYNGSASPNFLTTQSLITDAYNHGPAAVKASSTAAVASDPALVVAVSPNNSVTVAQSTASNLNTTIFNGGITTSGSIAGNGNILLFPNGLITSLLPYNGITLEVSGTWNATLTLTGSNGNSYYTIDVVNLSNPGAGPQNTITSNGLYYANIGSVDLAFTASGYVSGTVICYAELMAIPLQISGVGSTQVDQLSSVSYPDPVGSYTSGTDSPTIDPYGNLETRGPVFSDEGSFRDDFTGTGVGNGLVFALTGTLNFTNGSTNVTGTGTNFTSLTLNQYIKKQSDSETLFVQISSIQSNTQLTLATAYQGTTATGVAAYGSNWITQTGAGATISNNTGNMVMQMPTTVNITSYIGSLIDYAPLTAQFYAAQRYSEANSTTIFGFQSSLGLNPQQQVTVQMGGALASTQVNFVTSYDNGGYNTTTTTVTLPNGLSTVSTVDYALYKIDFGADEASLSVNGILLATNNIHLPSPYTPMYFTAMSVNGATAPANGNYLFLDSVFVENLDRVSVYNTFTGDPQPVQGNQLEVAGYPSLTIQNSENRRATYSTSIINSVPPILATDIFTITGSATKVIRVTRVEISATQTTSGYMNISIGKRTTANTGGTSTTLQATLHDSTDTTASATVLAYTANPTTGTSAGSFRAIKYWAPATTTVNTSSVIWDFGDRNNKPIILRGTGEVLAVNLAGVTYAGNSFDFSIEWTEDYN